MARLPKHVTRVDTGDGVRYEVRIHGSRSDGSRFHHKRRFKTPAEATAWHSKITSELAEGTHTAPSDLTVKQAIETWLKSKSARVKQTTSEAYTAALQPVVDRYGDVKVQKITKHDVEELVTELRTGSGDRGVWARTSINPMLARWRKVWADLHAEGVLARNVVALVEPLRKPSGAPAMKTDDSLSDSEVEKLIAAHTGSDDHHAQRRELFLHLALLGLRRAEIAGLRWSAIDLDADKPTLSVRETRVSTAAGVIAQEDAKTAASSRELPIPLHVIPIVRRVRKVQLEMRLAAGRLWEGESDGYLMSHDLGRALSPRTLNYWWTRSLDFAGIPRRRLHASRHTAASVLERRGASPAVIAAWLGHADGGVLAMRTYVHVNATGLAVAAKLLSS
ncbi:tyrosine-type recombinase/integrase [Mycobacterium sp. SMC-19]|uniref:tyrosine-type recombinase/integrase n=1 Tax=Mycobacterium sp. SMC-19 TaxID=3381630 RepID=UPI0038765741